MGIFWAAVGGALGLWLQNDAVRTLVKMAGLLGFLQV
jgi:hypothetical protein